MDEGTRGAGEDVPNEFTVPVFPPISHVPGKAAHCWAIAATMSAIDQGSVSARLYLRRVSTVTERGVEIVSHVPVVRNALVAVLVLERLAVRRVRVREEGHEVGDGELSLRLGARVVGHERRDERVGGGGERDTGEYGSKVVRVGGDAVLLPVVLVLGEDVHRDVVRAAT